MHGVKIHFFDLTFMKNEAELCIIFMIETKFLN